MHPIRTIVGVVALLFASVGLASAQTTAFIENCTVSVDTSLTSHTPNVGSGWTAFEDTTAGAAVPKCDNDATNDDVIKGTATTSASSRVLVQANPSTPLTNADYYIEVTKTTEAGSADDLSFIWARATDNSNYYGFGWYREADGASECVLFEVVADVYTQLDVANCNFAVGQVARFDLTGTTLSVTLDGVATGLSVTDTTYTLAGTAGLGWGNIRTATDDVDANVRLDGFTIVAAAGAPPTNSRYVCAAGDSSCGGTPAYTTINLAIDAASFGDTIYVKAGETFDGFDLDNKGACTAATSRIVIRSTTADSLLPPANQRITPTYSALLPFIQSPDSDSAVDFAPGACGYTLKFLRFGSNLRGVNTVIQIGSNDVTQQFLADQPSYITIDRVFIDGDPFYGGRHGVELNGASLDLINSYCRNMNTIGFDSQCVTAFNGSGPILIENNYLEGGTENILIGGVQPEMRSCALVKASPAPTQTVFELEHFRGTQDNGCDITETAASEPDHTIATLAVGQRLCVTVSADLTVPSECITVKSKALNVVTLTSTLSQAPPSGAIVFWGTELADVVVRRNHLNKPSTLKNPPIATPTDVTATLDTTTGTLAAGTYYYKVVCFATGNESNFVNSHRSNEVSHTLTDTGSIKIAWTVPTYATTCRVYGRSSNGQNMYWIVTAPTASYVDTGSAGTTGAPPAKGSHWAVKNVFEIKFCSRCIVEYNVIEGHFQGSTTVHPITIKTSNSNGQNPRGMWVNGDDLIMRYNVIRKGSGCYTISGYQHGTGALRNRPQPAARMLVHDNICYDSGGLYNFVFDDPTPTNQDQILVFDALNNWTIRNNTTIMDQRAVISFENANPFGTNAFRDNIAFKGDYGIRGNDQQLEGTASCTFYSGTTCTNNVIAGGTASRYTGNLTPTRLALQAAFVNYGGPNIADYALTAGHAYRTAGTGGGMIGADIDALVTGTAGVVGGTPAEFPIFSTLTLPNGTEQTPYSAQIVVTGGTGAKTCAITAGTQPTGLSLSSACLLAGTPTTAGDYTFAVTATDTLNAAANKSYTVTIAAAAPSAVTITTTTIPDGTTVDIYAQTLSATGGAAAYSWSIVTGSGTMPPGWVLSPTQGTITGLATTTGVFCFTVRVSSGALTDTENYCPTVAPGPPPPPPAPSEVKRARKWNGQELFTFVREDCSLLISDDRPKVGDICVDFYNRIWVVSATSPAITVREAKLPPERLTVTVDAATTFAVTSSDYIVLACTGAETISTITGGVVGRMLTIENADTDCTIADDDSATAANAIDLTGTATNDVGAVAKVITLIYNGSHWLQLYESDN